MRSLPLTPKSNDTERVLRALPEIVTRGEVTYLLRIGKTGDTKGTLSRFYVGYTNGQGSTLCWYEEGTMYEAANQALGKVLGFKEETV